MALVKRIKDGALFFSMWALDKIVVLNYNGEYQDLIRGHGHDLLLPAGLYSLSSAIWPSDTSRLLKAGVVFLGCSALEILQYFGLYGGTFDPKDFLAYATGIGLGISLETLTDKLLPKREAKAY